MAYIDNMEYTIRGGWDEASQSYTGCVTPNDGVIYECRVRELIEIFNATEEELKTAYDKSCVFGWPLFLRYRSCFRIIFVSL